MLVDPLMRIRLGALAIVVASCGGDDDGETSVGSLGTTGGSGPVASADGSVGVTGGSANDGPTSSGDDAPGPTSDTSGAPDSGSDGADDDGGPGASAPVQLYRGSVAAASIPGWDPGDPRPLLMMGRLGETWVSTLARIGDDGTLSENLAEEIVVWGWDIEPPQLYDGVVGGVLTPWSSADPYPVVLVGHRDVDGAWVTTLSSIDAAGTLGDNAADRLVVWGWSAPSPAAPSTLYDGPVVGGTVPGWNPEDPAPLVMLGRLPASDTWQATLASIEPDGALGMNVAEQIIVWGW